MQIMAISTLKYVNMSLSKNLDSLKACIKKVNKEFTGISKTHLKDKPNDYLNLPRYNIECANGIGQEKGGVCMFISDKVKYKLMKDLCHAIINFESCLTEIESKKLKEYCHRSCVQGS